MAAHEEGSQRCHPQIFIVTTSKLTGENQDTITEFGNYTLTEIQTSLKISCSRKESREFIGYCGLFEQAQILMATEMPQLLGICKS